MPTKESKDDQSTRSKAPRITVGVITHEGRFNDFPDFLIHLLIPLQEYEKWSNQSVELLVVNNSGATTSLLLTEETTQALTRSGIIYKIIDSPKNNIATGRNIVLDQAQHSHVAFIDDDEIARPDWLIQLT